MHLPYRFIPASVLLLSIVSWIFAAPVVNGSKVRQFLGGVTGKLVYTVFEGENGFKNGRALYYVDFKDEILIERKIIQENDAEPRNAIISNDGIWVTYNTMDGARQSQSFICKVMENAPEKITIGNGAHPHWWVKPGTFEEYIITNTGDLETFWQLNFPSAPQAGVGGGETYCQRIIDKRPSGNRTTLLPYFANAGRSRDGAWMFTSGRATGMYHIDSLATNNATIKEEIPFNDTI